ncbi:unnamed protein product [Hyaloperonospora brassicae]|uniref:Uncharacterized protein n=1 Tax=Hyaloperonospora brassicae TaxID=162125 RepID=A0AAV0TJW9_HYABA|nr:unnamed protein product [Hyaloperonospora brassicae]
MAPHKAFKKLKLQQYNRELFDEALLPLLKEYVILYNKFEPKATTTLAKELSLLRRTGEPKKTVVEHAETG